MDNKTYDIILFGVTGFTGKLAAEYLFTKDYNINWAACARNESKGKEVLRKIAESCGKQEADVPPILVADLLCNNPEQEETLRSIVQSTKVVLTTAGPFEKYGQTLFKLCAQCGVHYADITGETSFVRKMIDEFDDTARESGAIMVNHCGNDCIPQDLTVWEMHKFAASKGGELVEAVTYVEFPPSASLSGGTITTAVFQLGANKRKNKDSSGSSASFDPLLRTAEGTKSEYKTKVTHKAVKYVEEFERKAGPWLMAPVMANCVRRSNAILKYNTDLKYGDALLMDPSWSEWVKSLFLKGFIGAAIMFPPLQVLLPNPGEGPSREDMDAGYLIAHGRGTMVINKGSEEGKQSEAISLFSKFHFKKDIGYLMTAELLVETGMLLLETTGKVPGGVVTPAVAFGSDMTQRIVNEMDATFEIKEEHGGDEAEERI